VLSAEPFSVSLSFPRVVFVLCPRDVNQDVAIFPGTSTVLIIMRVAAENTALLMLNFPEPGFVPVAALPTLYAQSSESPP
jgi:hypothetical protein